MELTGATRLHILNNKLISGTDWAVTTKTTERGGGNVYLTLFMSKAGKACCRVYDPNSEGAKEARAKKQAALSDDLPF